MKRFPVILSLLTILMMGCGAPDKSSQNGDNDIPGGNLQAQNNFAYLMNHYQRGKPEPVPWAGYWWPYAENGIASGKMSGGASPAGKYDAVHGRTAHSPDSAQTWEVENHGSKVPHAQGWWGHCNGWCAASALFPEPHEAVRVNGVTFDVADIKGLLTEASMESSADFFGERMEDDNASSPKYLDTVPDQYFLVLTNYIGRLKQTVLIDRYTGYQVWNQPLAGYTLEYPKPSDYLGEDPQAHGIYKILVSSTMFWQDDGVSPSVQTPPFNYADNETVQSRQLRMEVWLDGPVNFDSNGKITSSGNVVVTRNGIYAVGGAWRMGDGYMVDAWPDYMWVPYSAAKPTDYANPYIDINWIKAHLLVPGGADDDTVPARPVETAPPIEPTHEPSGRPTSIPTYAPIPNPGPTHH